MSQVFTGTKDISPFLKLGVDCILEEEKMYPNEWKQFYTTVQTKQQSMTYVEERSVTGARKIPEFGRFPIGTGGVAYQRQIANFKYGLAAPISEEAVIYNLYPDRFPASVRKIKDHLHRYREYNAIAPFDNAFNPAGESSAEYLGPDGLPICSTNHPIDNGTYSNKITDAQLSTTSYQSLIKAMQGLRSAAGEIVAYNSKILLVGLENQFTADVIFGSRFDPNSANNAINPLVSLGYNKGGYVISHYTANPKNYFLLTDEENGIVAQEFRDLTSTVARNDENLSYTIYVYQIYRHAIWSPRAVIGCQSN